MRAACAAAGGGRQETMDVNESKVSGSGRGTLVGGIAVIYFIAALEIVIMISPFAAFFYSVFNPILLGLNQSSLTRWLTAFFLPHMMVPPNSFLLGVRVAGSVLSLGGSLLFLVCAGQVYLGKLFKWGVASRGFYALVRHPQYTALSVAGLGLAILWPRMLTLMFLSVMIFLYYLLARDEERRMLGRYGDGYRAYLERTGMFWPRLTRKPVPARQLSVRLAVLLLTLLVGGAAALGLGLRAYTVANLPLRTVNGIDVTAVMPSDMDAVPDLPAAVRADPTASGYLHGMQGPGHVRILAYVVPVEYVMQGMIANTGEEWKLFRHHQTFAMIADYVLHPIGHLQGMHIHHMGMMAPGSMMHHDPSMHMSPMMRRRIIFLEVRGRPLATAGDDFRVNNERIPRFFADVHLHTHEVLQVKETPHGTGWGDVPTPSF